MIEPVALFITWTTYGTWLPGDERGHVSNTFRPEGGFRAKENRPGAPYAAGDQFASERARELQKWPTALLTSDLALTVANNLVEVAVKREWMILRAAVMSSHVHTLVAQCPLDGPQVRRILKGNTQAALSDAVRQNRRWWTAGGSDRKRSGDRSIEATTQYIADQPGKLAEVIENRVCVRGRDPDLRG